MGGAFPGSNLIQDPLLGASDRDQGWDSVQALNRLNSARRVAKNWRRNFKLVRNLRENKNWMLNSTIFLKQRSTIRTEVEEAFEILEKAGKRCQQFRIGMKRFQFNSDLEDLTVGPALSHALRSNYVTWGFFVAMAAVGHYFVHVDPDTGLAAFPRGPGLLSGVALLVFYMSASLYYEVRAAYYVLPTQGCAVDREAVGHADSSEDKESLCGAPLKFDKWMMVMLFLSVCCRLDVFTASIWFARARRSVFRCDSLEIHWRQVLEQSPSLKAVAGSLTFKQMVYVAWFGMLCQFLYALAYSIPLWSSRVGKGVNYKVVESMDGIAEYDTLCKKKQTHGRAVQALADSGRMNCLNWQDDYYLTEAEMEWPLKEVAGEMRRVNIRFILFAVQALLVPNLQVTFMGMHKVVEALQGQKKYSRLDQRRLLRGLRRVRLELHLLRAPMFAVSLQFRQARKRSSRTR